MRYFIFEEAGDTVKLGEGPFMVARMGFNGGKPAETMGVKPKPAFGSPCNNCGVCCRVERCSSATAMDIPFYAGRGCAAQVVTPDGVLCALAQVEQDYIQQHPGAMPIMASMEAWGSGCDAYIARYEPDNALSDWDITGHKPKQALVNTVFELEVCATQPDGKDTDVKEFVLERLVAYKAIWKANYEIPNLSFGPATTPGACGSVCGADSACERSCGAGADPTAAATGAGTSERVGSTRTGETTADNTGSATDNSDSIVAYVRLPLDKLNCTSVRDVGGIFAGLADTAHELKKRDTRPMALTIQPTDDKTGILIGIWRQYSADKFGWSEGMLRVGSFMSTSEVDAVCKFYRRMIRGAYGIRTDAF